MSAADSNLSQAALGGRNASANKGVRLRSPDGAQRNPEPLARIRHRPGLRLRSIRATGPPLCRPPVNPTAQKYSALPKFGIGVCVAHPGSFLRGDLVVVTFASRACGGRGSVRVRVAKGRLLSVSPR